MSSTNNFYELLGVTKQANNEQIKKAFFLKIKQIGGPERNPEEYKKLREAYDTLYNPIARAEYDSMSLYGEEINSLIKSAENEFEKECPNYDLIIRDLKKAVVLGPQISRLRNLLGDAFFEKEDYKAAYEQYNKACKLDGTNPLYWSNFGMAAEKCDLFTVAEKSYKKAIEIDPNLPSNNINLAYFYYNRNRENEAYQIIEEAINADGVVDFADFSYFYHRVIMLIIDGNMEEVSKNIDEIIRIAKNDDDKKFAAWMFWKFALELYEDKNYALISKITNAMLRLEPDCEEYQNFHKFSNDNCNAQDDYLRLQKDGRIHDIVKEFARIYVGSLGGFIKDDDYNEQIKEVSDILDDFIDVYPDGKNIIDSVKILKNEYHYLFDLNKGFFNEIINLKLSGFRSFRGKCPFCDKNVITEWSRVGNYICPHCNNGIYYGGTYYSKSSSKNSSNNSSDCFILTAVYNDAYHPNVLFMRKYRDQRLNKFLLGKMFISAYYKLGPVLAKRIENKKIIKIIIKKWINILVSYLMSKYKL